MPANSSERKNVSNCVSQDARSLTNKPTRSIPPILPHQRNRSIACPMAPSATPMKRKRISRAHRKKRHERMASLLAILPTAAAWVLLHAAVGTPHEQWVWISGLCLIIAGPLAGSAFYVLAPTFRLGRIRQSRRLVNAGKCPLCSFDLTQKHGRLRCPECGATSPWRNAAPISTHSHSH